MMSYNHWIRGGREGGWGKSRRRRSATSIPHRWRLDLVPLYSDLKVEAAVHVEGANVPIMGLSNEAPGGWRLEVRVMR